MMGPWCHKWYLHSASILLCLLRLLFVLYSKILSPGVLLASCLYSIISLDHIDFRKKVHGKICVLIRVLHNLFILCLVFKGRLPKM